MWRKWFLQQWVWFSSAWLAHVVWKPLRSHRGGGRGGSKAQSESAGLSQSAWDLLHVFCGKGISICFFPLTFWLLFTFPGFLKPQGRNMKEDTHRALKDCCLCVHMHVCVCVYVFMYVSCWTERAYFLSEKPIACAQNEVLNRMLSSSGEVRAAWGNGCCSSVRGCAECLAQSSTILPWLVWGSEHLQELPTVSWWFGEKVILAPPLGTSSRQWNKHWPLSPDVLRTAGETSSSLRPK